MDTIKICYNWIGPRGPIWNTELPTILSFAAASADVGSITSKHYWVDDIWQKLFSPLRPKFDLYPASLIDEKDTFIYPFSLGWRVPWNYYFFKDNGLMEHGHTPNHIIHHVRNSKGYILIDMGAEAYIQDQHLSTMTDYFRDHHGIPMSKIIYLTGCMNAAELYKHYCRRNNIPDTPRDRMNILSFPASQQSYATLTGDPNHTASIDPVYDTELVPEKLFLMWNRRFRTHRTNLAVALDKAGLVDRSYVSMLVSDPESNVQTFSNTVNIYQDPELNLTNEDVERFSAKLPLIIDGETNVHEMCGDFKNDARKFYTNSLVSIVTETNFDLSEMTLTEKTFKPIREMHPFINVGVPGSLRVIRDLGFKTFHDFWDESYDTEYDHRVRMKKIVELCVHLSTWNRDQILEFKRAVKPLLEHNRQLLKIRPALGVANNIHDIISRGVVQ